ncbi:hypothetical protein HPB48_006595 [Haemaphysalis longicornis]|uniref:ubiquitinyl hydrolase 1 n=1 Tax=Haemaphysalis longicornis TaxID=44386 RepID=A0A9J6GDH6_HAELO|nr:hypothetical protein HPB48_006595 [Haemaphysalis longicornis]
MRADLQITMIGRGEYQGHSELWLPLYAKHSSRLPKAVPLQKECLEGSNQYSCEVCGGKRNAVRCIRLRRLPPVLSLQLLRFNFDRQAGCRKINTAVQFSESLDLSPHLQQPAGSTVYSLVAVLIHQGPSANSGHYVAHIKDRTSGSWYRFNDDGVCKMRGRQLQLNTDDESPTHSTGSGEERAYFVDARLFAVLFASELQPYFPLLRPL